MQISHQYRAQHATECIVRTSCGTLHAMCQETHDLSVALSDTKESPVAAAPTQRRLARIHLGPRNRSRVRQIKNRVTSLGRSLWRTTITIKQEPRFRKSANQTVKPDPKRCRRAEPKKAFEGIAPVKSANRRCMHKAWQNAASIRDRFQPQAKAPAIAKGFARLTFDRSTILTNACAHG